MLRFSYSALIVLTILFTAACKKDVVHWEHVQKLNSNTTSRLNHIKFLGDNICIASGGLQFLQSDVARSTDGGYTWNTTSYPAAPKGMYGMGIAPNGNIYLSGIDGYVLYSADSGNTWQANQVGNWHPSVGGMFPVPDTGIFVSTILQRQCAITRVDANFRIIDEHTYLFGLNNMYMTDGSTGYVIGYGAVMKTTDRGNNWNFQDVKGDNFTAMDIHGDQIWLCGFNGGVYHTWDGGEHWERYRNGNDISLPRYYMLDIVFKDDKNGWAVCDDGKVIHSDDGGRHWAEYDRFTTSSLRSIALCPNGDLLAAGDNGAIYRIVPQQ